MAEVNSTSWGTSVIPLYDLPTPWQLKVVAGIYIWLVFAHVTSFTKHLRALVQPFVLRRVESGVPVLLAIQVPCVHYTNAFTYARPCTFVSFDSAHRSSEKRTVMIKSLA